MNDAREMYNTGMDKLKKLKGGNMRLRDLIHTVRQCGTAAAERDIIAKECALIRTSMANNQEEYRQRNVFVHMLGYPSKAGQMECIRLIASQYYSDKRIGYLGLMLLLDESQEILTLATHSIKQDLNHPNQYVVGLALCALGNIASPEISRDVTPDVIKLFESSNPHIRKKAALCAVRIMRKAPEIMSQFVDKIKTLIVDRHHGVLLTATTLMVEILETGKRKPRKYLRPLVPVLVRILKSLALSGYTPEYDVFGITDPFLQVKVLRALRYLGRNDKASSDQMNDVLAQVATNTEDARNVGNAIKYECVQTILSIRSEPELRELAINILGTFLGKRDNNLRYVALHTLHKVVGMDLGAVQRHRRTIVDCLKDPDISIKRRALDLVYSLVNEQNIRMLVREMLAFLLTAAPEFRPDLTAKICLVTDKFAPTRQYHFDTILRVMTVAGDYVSDEVVARLVTLIGQTPELHPYAVEKLYVALQRDLLKQSLVQVGVWTLGEYADLPPASDADTARTPQDLLELFQKVLVHSSTTPQTKELTLTALAKLASRQPSVAKGCHRIIHSYTTSMALELQNRACEYDMLLRQATEKSVRDAVLAKVPPMEERETQPPAMNAEQDSSARRSNGSGAPAPVAGSSTQSAAGAGERISVTAVAPAPGAGDDLLSLLTGGVPSSTGSALTPAATSQSPAGGLSSATDLLAGLGLGPSPLAPMGGAPGASFTPMNTSPAVSSVTSAPIVTLAPTPLSGAPGGLGGMLTPSSPAGASMSPVGPALAGAPATVLAYQKNGVSIKFELVHPKPQQPHLTLLTANITSVLSQPLTELAFLTSVPPYIKMMMGQPSSLVLSPGSKITQEVKLNNTEHGKHPLKLRFKLTYKTPDGNPFEDVVVVDSFPAGF
eukprot:CAMPEP_0177681762 /NCGR_PEP_ID=MMETSP0447-20121125/30897_1 /TAXON_ID=0 /ORGANISM="Stygamoeba regulata, Strain BSH-02190019" /LENGTH=892 /DNA_ID=CAMNT_0019191217 /DNA_START=41 /DNA_END=2719 /DNA_ORIENTATION=-